MNQHRTGISPGFLTKHRLVLQGLNDINANAIVAELDQLPCMDSVIINRKKQSIKLHYDASRHHIDEMIAIVIKHGATVKEGWWNHIRLGWQRQIDQNIKENAQHEPHCCNKNPRH